MRYLTIKNTTTILLIIVFFMPIIGTMMISAKSSVYAHQYNSIQLVVMGMYNIPFFVTALITWLIAGSLYKKSKENVAKVLLFISIGASITGSLLMLIWGIGSLV